MCYILKSVFCSTPEGQFEFKGMDQWLLGCSENPPAECHFNHPASFLNPAAHRFILTRIGNDTTVPKSLRPLQEKARQLLKNEDAKIQNLKDISFIFFPRWMEDGVLCRQVGLNGDEIVMRLDGVTSVGHLPLTIDMQRLRASKNDSSDSSLSTSIIKTAGTISTDVSKNSISSCSTRPKRSCQYNAKYRFT